MSDVYLPLPYTPNNPREEPRVLFKLGSIYQDLELGQEYDLKNPVSIFSGTLYGDWFLSRANFSTVTNKQYS